MAAGRHCKVIIYNATLKITMDINFCPSMPLEMLKLQWVLKGTSSNNVFLPYVINSKQVKMQNILVKYVKKCT